MTDNPFPKMHSALSEARIRIENTHETAAKAFQYIRTIHDQIGVSMNLFGSTESAQLRAKLTTAQEDYQAKLKEHSDALIAYREYFHSIADQCGV